MLRIPDEPTADQVRMASHPVHEPLRAVIPGHDVALFTASARSDRVPMDGVGVRDAFVDELKWQLTASTELRAMQVATVKNMIEEAGSVELKGPGDDSFRGIRTIIDRMHLEVNDNAAKHLIAESVGSETMKVARAIALLEGSSDMYMRGSKDVSIKSEDDVVFRIIERLHPHAFSSTISVARTVIQDLHRQRERDREDMLKALQALATLCKSVKKTIPRSKETRATLEALTHMHKYFTGLVDRTSKVYDDQTKFDVDHAESFVTLLQDLRFPTEIVVDDMLKPQRRLVASFTPVEDEPPKGTTDIKIPPLNAEMVREIIRYNKSTDKEIRSARDKAMFELHAVMNTKSAKPADVKRALTKFRQIGGTDDGGE